MGIKDISRQVESLSKYIIPFSGLSQGIHEYEYHIDKDFFAELEYSLLSESSVDVKVSMNKTETMLLLDFDIEGTVNLQCDRCTDYFDLPVKGRNKLIVKFGEATVEENDLILILSDKEHELNISQYIYEYINLLVPMRHLHQDDAKGNSTCNQEMLDIIEKVSHKQKDPDEIDPRWEALKKLKNLN
ncbi:MAG: YceD family protein [Bacteroidia bacterium]